MKKLVTLIVVVTFCFSMAGIASAAPGQTQQAPAVGSNFPTPEPIFACPAGWHKKPNASMTCIPNKPAPINCPKGKEYFEALSCTEYSGVCQEGCMVGCRTIPPR